MITHPLSFLLEVAHRYLYQSGDRFAERVRTWDQFPSSLSLDDAPYKPLLSGGLQQTAIQVSKLALAVVVGPWQTRQIIAVKQAGRVSSH